MATIATTSTPHVQAPVDGVGVPIAGRFPTPPSAFSFLTTPEITLDISGPTAVLGAALQHEGSHMEPRKGQVWPR